MCKSHPTDTIPLHRRRDKQPTWRPGLKLGRASLVVQDRGAASTAPVAQLVVAPSLIKTEVGGSRPSGCMTHTVSGGM